MRKWIRGGSWLATREISFKMCWFIPNNFCIKIWKRRNSTEWWSTHFVGVITPHHRLSCHLQSRPCIYVLTNQATIITMHTNTDAIHFIRTSVMFPSVHDGLKIDRVKKHTRSLDGAINYTRCPVFLFCSTHLNRCLWFVFLFLTRVR